MTDLNILGCRPPKRCLGYQGVTILLKAEKGHEKQVSFPRIGRKPEEAKETWQLNVLWHSEENLGIERGYQRKKLVKSTKTQNLVNTAVTVLFLFVALQSLSRVLLWPLGLPFPSLSPRVCSNSYPLHLWCHPTISSSVARFSFCLRSFPASGSFPVSQLFTSSGQSIRALASASVLPNEYSGWISFRIDWFDLLAIQGTLQSLLQHHNLKASILQHSAFFRYNSHIHTWLVEKP